MESLGPLIGETNHTPVDKNQTGELNYSEQALKSMGKITTFEGKVRRGD